MFVPEIATKNIEELTTLFIEDYSQQGRIFSVQKKKTEDANLQIRVISNTFYSPQTRTGVLCAHYENQILESIAYHGQDPKQGRLVHWSIEKGENKYVRADQFPETFLRKRAANEFVRKLRALTRSLLHNRAEVLAELHYDTIRQSQQSQSDEIVFLYDD